MSGYQPPSSHIHTGHGNPRPDAYYRKRTFYKRETSLSSIPFQSLTRMNILHDLVCVHSANLLRSVPIPETFGDIFRLSFKDLVGLTVFGAVTGVLGYSIYTTATLFAVKKGYKINHNICKHLNKCVDSVDLESIADKKVYCRCWRSSKFPYCDGSHNKHNEETGDNVGPLILNPKRAS
ncbi:unnamed protein product [Dicrocoelium dendriticum]|nr:unnamed protein product [Dicrocoelium dendriticum]